MIPSEFGNFFLASAGASAALVGLLFVAVSIAPERTVMAHAPVERQAMAASAFTALLNAFFISLGALLPIDNNPIPLLVSTMALVSTLTQLQVLLKRKRDRLNIVRRTVLFVESLLIYAFQWYYSWLLFQGPTQRTPIYVLCGLLLGVYGIGIIRAWQLLGVHRYGLFGWLSPLRDVDEEAVPQADNNVSPVVHSK